MTEQIDISIVIVIYQNENEITACLESLIRELESRRSQIIVIDNNSQDRTKQVLQEFEQSDNVRLIFNEENRGFTNALNQGLRECKGSFTLTLNPDVVLQSGCLTTLLATLRENKQVGIGAPQLLNSDDSIQPSCRRFPKRRDVLFQLTGLNFLFPKSRVLNGWKMGDFDHQTKRFVEQPQGAFLLFRRSVLQEVGLWDERFPMFFSDVDWCKRVKESGYEIVFVPSAKAIHRQGASVFQSRAKMIWSSHRSFYKYFKKHRPKPNLVNEIVGVVLIFSALVRIIWTLFFRRRTSRK